MTAMKARTRILSGCLVTMLLPAGAVLASSQGKPGSKLCSVRDDRETALRTGVAPDPQHPALTFDKARASPVTAPWFRKTFVLFQADAACAVKPADGAPSIEPVAKAQLAVPKLQPPGVVQNLRFTEEH